MIMLSGWWFGDVWGHLKHISYSSCFIYHQKRMDKSNMFQATTEPPYFVPCSDTFGLEALLQSLVFRMKAPNLHGQPACLARISAESLRVSKDVRKA